METVPEPWLRGPVPGVSPLIAPILYSFEQAREDLTLHTEGLTGEQIWARPYGFGSVGFHLRHIAGATDRLMTYLQGRALEEHQWAALRDEEAPRGPSRDELLSALDGVFAKAELIVHRLDPSTLAEPRLVGRKGLPSTVAG